MENFFRKKIENYFLWKNSKILGEKETWLRLFSSNDNEDENLTANEVCFLPQIKLVCRLGKDISCLVFLLDFS